MSKPKILCLHGYGTNANFMQKQAVSFIKLLSRENDLVFVDGPFQAPQNFVMDQKVIDLIEGSHRSWIPKVHSNYDKEQFLSQLQKLRIVFEKASDHYDGILGFSQGAIMIHLILYLQKNKMINWKILQKIKFVILMSGNHLRLKNFDNKDTQLDIPSVHIISPEDFLYPQSLLYTTRFKNPIVISHSYGHKFPKLGLSISKTLVSFIKKHSGNSQKKRQQFQLLNLSSL